MHEAKKARGRKKKKKKKKTPSFSIVVFDLLQHFGSDPSDGLVEAKAEEEAEKEAPEGDLSGGPSGDDISGHQALRLCGYGAERRDLGRISELSVIHTSAPAH
jgi:hypothetical protein